jgi:hypothetical protein
VNYAQIIVPIAGKALIQPVSLILLYSAQPRGIDLRLLIFVLFQASFFFALVTLMSNSDPRSGHLRVRARIPQVDCAQPRHPCDDA